jgi:hypothetical protein
MDKLKNSFAIEEIGKALQLKFPELGALVESLKHRTTQYDFFAVVAMHIVPLIRKTKQFKTLTNRWEREVRSSKKNLEELKEKALKEVTAAFHLLSKRIESNVHILSIPEVQQTLSEAKGYLEGTRPVYMPSHFEMAADSLFATCRLLVKHNAFDLLEGIAEITYLNNNKATPGIERCHFYNGINKMIKKQQEWSWEFYHLPYTCWCHLKFSEQLWNLKEKAFEGKELKKGSIEECNQSGELLGLHGYWVELQSIRNKKQNRTPFFTIERFSKFLHVVCSEILTLKTPDAPETPLLGITSLSLLMRGEHLLLLVEEQQKKTPYLLHRFTGNPYDFFEYLLKNPGKDASPPNFGMPTNSTSNLLDRAKINGPLRKLFFRLGRKKNSIQLISSQIALKDLPLSVRLSLEEQLIRMNLSSYNSVFDNTMGSCE